MTVPVPAIVTAGDRGAARAIRGMSKMYLEIDGRPLISHVVAVLQRVPEVSEVYVIGDSSRLDEVLGRADLKAELCKPLHILEQRDNLYNNAWHAFGCSLPGGMPDGREPVTEAELDHQVLYLSGDLPFATPQEISEFVREGQRMDCDYVIGMTKEEAVDLFQRKPDQEGVPISYFNLREARLKQTNLHLTRAARIGNRHYIQDMYEQRKQREFLNMLGLAWRLWWSEQGGTSIVFFYLLIHVGGVFDRRGWRTLADWTRRLVSLGRVERSLAKLMKTRFRFAVTRVGGCAVDVDTEEEYDLICEHYDRWVVEHNSRVEAIGGQALAAGSQAEQQTAARGEGGAQ